MNERFKHPQLELEARYDENIRGYARIAEQLASIYIWPQNIWVAIKNEQGLNRRKIFSDVLRELKRREKEQWKKEPGDQIEKALRAYRKAELFRGAYANERSHPRDAWNNSYDPDEDRGDN